jgi:hypothetical protein
MPKWVKGVPKKRGFVWVKRGEPPFVELAFFDLAHGLTFHANKPDLSIAELAANEIEYYECETHA